MAARLVFDGTMLPGPTVREGRRRVLSSPARVRVGRYLKGHGPSVVRVQTALTRVGSGVTVSGEGIEPSAGQRWRIYSQGSQPLATSVCLGSRRLPQTDSSTKDFSADALRVMYPTVAGLSHAGAHQQGLYGGHAQSMRNRRTAYTDAASLLARLRVPADAQPERAIPRSRLHELEAADNHADVDARWTVPGTLSSVIAYVRRHRPRGSSVFSSGYSSSHGSIISRGITFAWRPLNNVLSDRHLYVSVASAGQRQVKIFAQAESIWLSARPQSERFPASTRRILLRIAQPHHRTLVREVTRAATVRRVVALLNAVPITQPVDYNCPALTKTRQFTYSLLGRTGRSLAQVRYQVPAKASPSPCETMSVAIGGQRQHSLLGGPQLVTVQRIFHIPTERTSL